MACWVLHYVKASERGGAAGAGAARRAALNGGTPRRGGAQRILESIFVHRFSKSTMPLFSMFRNCAYYWGFGAYIGYYINHPLYTPPSDAWVRAGGAVALCSKESGGGVRRCYGMLRRCMLAWPPSSFASWAICRSTRRCATCARPARG
jgi:hypothetical protein